MFVVLSIIGVYCLSIPLALWVREPASEEVIPTGMFGPTLTEKAAMNMPSMRQLFELPELLFWLVLSPIALVVMVLALPLIIVTTIVDEWRSKSYSDPCFKEIRAESLCLAGANEVETTTSELEEAGFHAKGTYRFKPECICTKAVRYFVSRDGVTVAAVYIGDGYQEFFLGTFFDADSLGLKPSAVFTHGFTAKQFDRLGFPEQRHENLWRQSAEISSTFELIECHRRWCDERTRKLGGSPVTIDKTNWQAAFIAAERMVAKLGSKNGKPLFKEVPDPPVVSTN